MTDPDPLMAALAALDPAAADPPPAAGSARDRQILERAMTTTDARPEPEAAGDPPPPVVPLDRRVPRRTRRWLLAGVGTAAAVVAVAGILVVGTPGDGPSPAAAVAEAADGIGEVDSLRVHAEYVDEEGTRVLDAEVDGADYRFSSRDGDDPGGAGEWTVVIGDQVWSNEDPEPVTVPAEERNAPFPSSSRAVLRAALQGAVVTDEGTEDVRGVEATHYRITLGAPGVAALAALPASVVAQFELEYPETVTSLDVWVADELIRRISLTFAGGGTDGTAQLDYYDLGADIEITPPA